MCLITRENHCRVADKPITCYKTASSILRRLDPDHGLVQRFKSVLYNFEYEFGVLYSLKETDNFILNNPVTDRELYVNVGFHSFATLAEARDDCLNYDKKFIENYLMDYRTLTNTYVEVLLKCEIPKGAKYWIGNKSVYYKGRMEYCSNRIKIVGWKFNGEKNWRKTIVKP
jgi:hypothetical protein